MRPRYRLQAGTRGTYLSPRGSSVFSTGGIALVQSASGTTVDGSAGLTVNFGVPVTAGNSVIALISYDNAEDPTGVLAFHLVGGGAVDINSQVVASNGTALATQIGLAYGGQVVGGETGAIYSTTLAVRASMTILEFSGLANAAAQNTSARSDAGQDYLRFNEVTPNSPANLIIGIGAYANATSDYLSGPQSPFTRIGTGVGGASVWQEVVYAIQESDTPQSENMWIYLNSSHDTATAAAAFGGA